MLIDVILLGALYYPVIYPYLEVNADVVLGKFRFLDLPRKVNQSDTRHRVGRLYRLTSEGISVTKDIMDSQRPEVSVHMQISLLYFITHQISLILRQVRLVAPQLDL